MLVLSKIISGGQTGVDRAALDVALLKKYETGGWCPKGRMAEDGVIPDKYPLIEMDTKSYPARTRMNVEKSCGTLIFTIGSPTGGTRLTVDIAKECKKTFFVADFNHGILTPELVSDWIMLNSIHILNVAGPRESKFPGIYQKARNFLMECL